MLELKEVQHLFYKEVEAALKGLTSLNQTLIDPDRRLDRLGRLLRFTHLCKAGGSATECTDIAVFADRLENLLSIFRIAPFLLDSSMADLVTKASGAIKLRVNQLQKENAPGWNIQALQEEIALQIKRCELVVGQNISEPLEEHIMGGKPIPLNVEQIAILTGQIQATVLVAEDDPELRALIVEEVTALNVEVETAEDGQKALELVLKKNAEKNPYMCVVSDIRMPRLTGVGLLGALRNQAIYTPVIFLSGLQDRELTLQVLRLGAFDLVSKPFQSRVLQMTVRAAVLNGQAIHQAIVALRKEAAGIGLKGAFLEKFVQMRLPTHIMSAEQD